MHSKERHQLVDNIVESIKNTVNFLPKDVFSRMNELDKEDLSIEQSRHIEIALKLYGKSSNNDSLYCRVDTGVPIFYIFPSQSMPIDLPDMLSEAIGIAHDKGYLIPSVVDPFDSSFPTNSGKRVPYFFYGKPEGNTTKVLYFPTASAADRLTSIYYLKPPIDNNEIIDIVRDTVASGDGRPCQPIVVGIGIGGSSDASMLLSKQALLRKIGILNKRQNIADLEKELLKSINSDGVGVNAVAMDVNIEYASCHRVVCPISISIMCRAARRSIMLIEDNYEFSIEE